MMGFGGLGMILWLVLLVAVVVIVIRLASGDGGDGSAEGGKESDALEILRRRYAAGEISHEEYEEKRRSLES